MLLAEPQESWDLCRRTTWPERYATAAIPLPSSYVKFTATASQTHLGQASLFWLRKTLWMGPTSKSRSHVVCVCVCVCVWPSSSVTSTGCTQQSLQNGLKRTLGGWGPTH